MSSLVCYGNTPEAVLKESKSLVVDILEELAEGGEVIPDPFIKKFNKKLVIRITEGLHRQLSLEAQKKGVSINELVKSKIAVGG